MLFMLAWAAVVLAALVVFVAELAIHHRPEEESENE